MKETHKGDPSKRPIRETYKETYKKDLQKRLAKESWRKETQKGKLLLLYLVAGGSGSGKGGSNLSSNENANRIHRIRFVDLIRYLNLKQKSDIRIFINSTICPQNKKASRMEYSLQHIATHSDTMQ